MGYPTKDTDKEIRDFLINSNKVELPEQQIIAREEGLPRKFPVEEVRLQSFSENELNVSQQRINYTFQIVIVNKMVREPRKAYDRVVDLADCTKVALKNDLTVKGAFKDTNFGPVNFSPVTLQNESETVPFFRVFMNDISCWRIEQI